MINEAETNGPRSAARRSVVATLLGAPLAIAFAGLPSAAFAAFRVTHTPAEWQKQLGAARYRILREAGTERPYSSQLDKEHRHGTFSCAGCAQLLFSSTTKFDSGTGWPSFWKPLASGVVTRTDPRSLFGATEVRCARCGGHLGHVFNDGPRPTGKRYCMNGLAMTFKAG
ncbi:MAG: peptide-methionine (R)-S-oxide reductase MsrB [Sphingomicrobium sp.]